VILKGLSLDIHQPLEDFFKKLNHLRLPG